MKRYNSFFIYKKFSTNNGWKLYSETLIDLIGNAHEINRVEQNVEAPAKRKKVLLRLVCVLFFIPSLWIDSYLKKQKILESLSKLKNPEIIYLDHFQFWWLIFPLNRMFPLAKIILVSHNLEYRNKISYIKYGSIGYKLASIFEVPSIYFWEMFCAKKCDGIIAINEYEKSVYQKVIKKGAVGLIYPLKKIDISHIEAKTKPPKGNLILVGSYGYKAKEFNAKWLIEEVIPDLAVTYPNIHLYLIGREASSTLIRVAQRTKNVTYVGEVKELKSWYDKAFAVCIPERLGGGFKLKIVEAICFKKPILIHKEAINGTGFVDGVDCLVFDDFFSFQLAYQKLIENQALYDSVIENSIKTLEVLLSKEKALIELERICTFNNEFS